MNPLYNYEFSYFVGAYFSDHDDGSAVACTQAFFVDGMPVEEPRKVCDDDYSQNVGTCTLSGSRDSGYKYEKIAGEFPAPAARTAKFEISYSCTNTPTTVETIHPLGILLDNIQVIGVGMQR